MSHEEHNDHVSRKAGRSKSLQSKYDYIKIKVWLGTDKTHYYILSRYILSRTLTCAKIPQDSVCFCTCIVYIIHICMHACDLDSILVAFVGN